MILTMPPYPAASLAVQDEADLVPLRSTAGSLCDEVSNLARDMVAYVQSVCETLGLRVEKISNTTECFGSEEVQFSLKKCQDRMGVLFLPYSRLSSWNLPSRSGVLALCPYQ